MNALRELNVQLYGQHVGVLSRTDAFSNNASLHYADSYRRQPDATPLSLSLPLTRADHEADRVSSWLWGLLPDNEILLERLASRAQVSGRDIFGLIAYVGRDVAGAAQFLTEVSTGPDDGLKLISADELAARVADIRRQVAEHAPSEYDNGRWSLAGAQAKVALRFEDDGWYLPEGREPSTHIIKPSIPGFENFDLNEAAILNTAQRIGLVASDATVLPLTDGTHALVSRRYDRAREPDGSWIRIHQEDLCQALGVRPGQKYEADGGPGVARIASLLKQLPSASRDARFRFFDALVFSWAVAATDGHAKNYSLLLDGAQARLAPIYDVNSALPYTRPWGRRYRDVKKLHSAHTINTTSAFTRITVDDWQAVAHRLSVPRDTVRGTLRRIATHAAATLPAVYTELADGIELEPAQRVNWSDVLEQYHHSLHVP